MPKHDSIHVNRRTQLAQLMPEQSVSLLYSSCVKIRNQDAAYAFRVDSSFWYLTGFDEPDSWLVIAKKTNEFVTAIYVPHKEEAKERWDGRRLGVEAAEKLGCTYAYANTELGDHLAAWLEHKQIIYSLPHQNQATRQVRPYLGAADRGDQYPQEWKNLGSLVYQMRWIKDATELATMRHAASINSLAHIQCMRQCAPGRFEYQLEAAHRYESLQHGALHQAYAPIVATGANACVLHYITNTKQLKDGDLVLIDAGCEYDYYASDITRTFPVNGKFTAIQRDLYELVLLAQQHAINACRPGNTWVDIHAAARKRLTMGLLDMKLLTGSYAECEETNALDAYYMHKTGHWLGLDVHDPSSYRNGRQAVTLEAGVVLTVEPGLYFDPKPQVPERVRGIGIRIEDDVLITDGEPEILTVAAPKLPDDMSEIIGCETGRRTGG